jgi:hypothetical protein
MASTSTAATLPGHLHISLCTDMLHLPRLLVGLHLVINDGRWPSSPILIALATIVVTYHVYM